MTSIKINRPLAAVSVLAVLSSSIAKLLAISTLAVFANTASAQEAHQCIAIDNAGSGNFGAFKNMCGFQVNFSTCNYRPRMVSGGFNYSADFDCERGKFGLHTPGAGASVAAHNRNTERVYWFACKAPSTPTASFVPGQGIQGYCR
jgi:hypothetical protein